MHSTHYGISQDLRVMKRWADGASREYFNKVRCTTYYPIFCYQGFSGITHATVFASYFCEHDFPYGMMLVRKDEDVKHHNYGFLKKPMFEYVLDVEYIKKPDTTIQLVFIDDLVEHGTTRDRVLSACSRFLTQEFADSNDRYGQKGINVSHEKFANSIVITHKGGMKIGNPNLGGRW